MTEDQKPKHKYAPRDDVDWAAVKRHWCANKVPVTQLETDYGVSRAAINKRAKKEGWQKDLSEDVDRATKAKILASVLPVVPEEVPKSVSTSRRLQERAVVEAYSDAAAVVDGQNRRDVDRSLTAQRSMLDELLALTDPAFRERLEWLGEVMDESGPTPNGGWKTDKVNELYQYVISLAGRIKMAKELAAAHGVYIPLQRKLFGLDGDKKSSPYEELLERLGQQQGG